MKKYSILFCLFLQMALAFAQAPEKMSYQAVVRNNNNVLVSNHSVGMRISILQGSATGTAVYTETQTPTTNANGLIAIEIGTGTVVTGSFANIDWANGPYFVKTETDPNGGTAYTLTASNQLLSVPYALYAKNGVPPGGQQGQSLTICDGQLVWATGGLCPAKIVSFNCADTVNTGNLYANVQASSVTTSVSYIGGNGGVCTSQNIPSTGVTGLIATLAAGNLNNGNGKLILVITGTPNGIGTANFTFNISGKTCTFSRSVIALPPIVNSFYINGFDYTYKGAFKNSSNTYIYYNGGNGISYSAKSFHSYGVSGLTASYNAGTLNNGDGNIVINISGIPNDTGIAYFNISFCSNNFILSKHIEDELGKYKPSTVHCNGTPTQVVDIINPNTGKTWMDRNLGATRAATSSTDSLAYGDLYQWGRGSDGHQCRNSLTTNSLSNFDQPGHSMFIIPTNIDWQVQHNENLWQGLFGINNPCPNGYRLPSHFELETERLSWNQNLSNTFNMPLKFTLAGSKDRFSGNITNVRVSGNYWGVTNYGQFSSVQRILYDGSSTQWDEDAISNGNSVRCIKD